MANRRMIARDVVGLDEFITLPYSAQALFLHLTVEADDGGFIGASERVLRLSGCTRDDLETLIEKGFLIRFDSGVVVLRHWRIANTLKNDRKVTNFLNELALLWVDGNNVYQLRENMPVPEIPEQLRDRLSNYQLGRR